MTQITNLDVAGSGMSFQHAKAAIDKINDAIARIDSIYPPTGVMVLGDGTGAPALTFDKADVEVTDLSFKSDSLNSFVLRHDASENLALRRYDVDGNYVDSPLSIAWATGNVALAAALAVTGTITPAAGFAGVGPGVPRVLAGAFVLADIEAGTKVFTTLPAGAIVTGASVVITTPLAFADGGVGDTTEVTLKAGTAGDDDAWLTTVALAGVAGAKYPTIAGAGIGMATAGGSGKFTLTFAASAGLSPDLADVSAGAGTVYLTYCMPV